MKENTIDDIKNVVRRYTSSVYPDAELVLLCGSWSRNTANDDSDIDILVLDPATTSYVFTCVQFESWLLELCVVSPENFDDYIHHDIRRRDSTVSSMYANGIVIHGDDELANEVKRKAQEIIKSGPAPLSGEEKKALRKELTLLLKDLKNSSADNIPALSAQCHTALAKAVIDFKGGWRGEQKTLRTALAKLDPIMADQLDECLILACQGNKTPLVKLYQEVIKNLGGELRTYYVEYPASN